MGSAYPHQDWAKWTPWQVGAVTAHTVGGIGFMAVNRLRGQPGGATVAVVKLVITGTAAYSGVLGLMLKLQAEAAAGVTTPRSNANREMAKVQQQLNWCNGQPGPHAPGLGTPPHRGKNRLRTSVGSDGGSGQAEGQLTSPMRTAG